MTGLNELPVGRSESRKELIRQQGVWIAGVHRAKPTALMESYYERSVQFFGLLLVFTFVLCRVSRTQTFSEVFEKSTLFQDMTKRVPQLSIIRSVLVV